MIFVFLPGYGRGDDAAIGDLAHCIGRPRIEAKMLLASRFPRKVFACRDPAEAQDFLDDLHLAGFDGFAVPKADIERRADVLTARGAALHPDRVEWEPLSSVRTRADVRAIFPATYRTSTEQEVKSHVAGVRAARRQISRSTEEQGAILVLGPHLHIFVEVQERGFNYRCLGPRPAHSAAANLQTLAARLRDIFPDALFDPSLLAFFGDSDAKTHVQLGGADEMAQTSSSRSESNRSSVIQMARLLAIQAGFR